MAGVIDHGDVGVAGAVGKIAQRAAGFGRRQILTRIDHVEAGVLSVAAITALSLTGFGSFAAFW